MAPLTLWKVCVLMPWSASVLMTVIRSQHCTQERRLAGECVSAAAETLEVLSVLPMSSGCVRLGCAMAAAQRNPTNSATSEQGGKVTLLRSGWQVSSCLESDPTEGQEAP